jgi:hypothetical protein
MTIGFDFDVPKARQASANGLQGGHVDLNLTITDLNAPQTITAPANPRPLSELQAQIAQLGSVLSGGSATTGATGTAGTTTGGAGASTASTGATATTGTGTDDAASAYSKCVQAAGGDIAQIQKCAPLLGQ